MKAWPALFAIVVLGAATTLPTVATMRGHRRVLLIATRSPWDPKAIAQRRLLSGWSEQAAARDVSLIEVSGSHVTGTADDAAALGKRFGFKPGKFQVLLIGKDGQVALRSGQPVAADKLQSTIDAMPMRLGGER